MNNSEETPKNPFDLIKQRKESFSDDSQNLAINKSSNEIARYLEEIQKRESLKEGNLSFLLKQVRKEPWPKSLFKQIWIIFFWVFFPVFGFIGRATRSHLRFLLHVLAASWGIIIESFSPLTWRRTVRYEFSRTLGQAIGGGFFSTLFVATLAGLTVVSQAIYWLGIAGLSKMTGPILITILVREVSPILVGMILLGRNGILTTTECGMLAMGGQLRSYSSIGIDPFLIIVVPRTWALTIASFTLGMIFGITSLFMGYLVTYVAGTTQGPVWTFYSDILAAMTGWDYLLIPLKFVVMGFMIGVGSCLTGMNIKVNDDPSTLLPKGFTRGILLIMIVNILFTLDF